MDREAAVIRSEMIQTRADLDRKLTALEARARELSPRKVVARRMPDYFWEKTLGGALTLAGLTMAWGRFRRQARKRRMREAAASATLDC